MKIFKRVLNGNVNPKVLELQDLSENFDVSNCKFNEDYFKIEDAVVTDYYIGTLLKDLNRYGTILTDVVDQEQNIRTKRVVFEKMYIKQSCKTVKL